MDESNKAMELEVESVKKMNSRISDQDDAESIGCDEIRRRIRADRRRCLSAIKASPKRWS